MKKLMKVLLSVLLALTIVGCQGSKESYSVKILCPTGAPALAFVSEYENIMKNGQIDFVDGTDMLIAEFSKANSDYDVIVAPINLGAKLIEKGQTSFKLDSVITWGNLYLVGTSGDALNGNGEIALFGEGAVPQKVFNTVNTNNELKTTYYQSATLVQQQLLAKKVSVGMLAEPLATATIAKAKQQGLELKVVKDLQSAYGDEGYPQAAIFTKGDKDLNALFKGIEEFTSNGYEGLQEYLETITVEKLGLPGVDIVVKSIERQNVRYKKASDCKDEIKDFLKLFNITYSDDMLA